MFLEELLGILRDRTAGGSLRMRGKSKIPERTRAVIGAGN